MSEFKRLATRESKGGFLRDCWHLARRTQKYWLVPLLLLLVVLGALSLLAGTAAAPFIYTLF